ncbi:large-conductance mechanosensitive channel [Clostridium polyendosporum]|uniref:Large-conductance mechanosensitive channel n=1 Tax=Clostridium polyendosporum TaxID=69208 RepID=A0A919RXP6_9CLOT|nr:large-conductance mechanosensitive channel protein MscL [Clostridium polyendosporum]GIM27671.1 large-conductance mechanosensitive channel [Clostridium polyendosporum]
MWKEFKDFAVKGDVLDLAIGVIIGGAFGKIVSSLVNDIIMPMLGFLIGGLNFTELKVVIREGSNKIPELSIKYGQFLQSVIDFLIISFSIFIFIKFINRFKKKQKEKEKVITPSKETLLLTDIRELLKEIRDNR